MTGQLDIGAIMYGFQIVRRETDMPDIDQTDIHGNRTDTDTTLGSVRVVRPKFSNEGTIHHGLSCRQN